LKFAFIQQQKVAFPVAALCRLLGVSTSGFYASEKRKDSRHSRRDAELARHIHALLLLSALDDVAGAQIDPSG
jgi:hypothetical protein